CICDRADFLYVVCMAVICKHINFGERVIRYVVNVQIEEQGSKERALATPQHIFCVRKRILDSNPVGAIRVVRVE
ncbi:hypothetical protein TNCV_2554141, partial [Trichonephila clavipes]